MVMTSPVAIANGTNGLKDSRDSRDTSIARIEITDRPARAHGAFLSTLVSDIRSEGSWDEVLRGDFESVHPNERCEGDGPECHHTACRQHAKDMKARKQIRFIQSP
jgi:hypothetical protein